MTSPLHTKRRVATYSVAGVAVAAMVFAEIIGDATGDPSVGAADKYVLLLAFAAFPVLGALIATRHPRNPLGYILLGSGVVVGLGLVGTAVSNRAFTEGIPTPLAHWGAWVADWYWYPGFGITTTFLVLLFPTGSLPSPRWRWLARVIVIDIVIITTLYMFSSRLRVDRRFVDNPVGLIDPATVEKIAGPLFPVLGICALIAAVSLVYRWRRARGQERLQLKWLTFAGVTFGIGSLAGGLLDLPGFLFAVLFLTLPVAVGIAMLKHRLYDIDLVINRTLVYGLLTAILAGAYMALVFGFQALLSPITAESDLVIAASTLAVGALFRPLRSRVQGFIDRRFYRRKFNAERTLEDFGGHLRDQVDLTALSSRLTAVVAETMQPAHVSLWIREPGRLDPVTISER